ncbi:Autophagy-related protein 22-2 [Erysiphe neolycopersici]|uniref:Autophagy-related protein n=1 Tax=Erysiphe neolycopersici TaxID=212602 RepID=A0A420I6W4_9PEZI|nr:Autophagy-related protein 22-2 [Erysiphe neolycopersici]
MIRSDNLRQISLKLQPSANQRPLVLSHNLDYPHDSVSCHSSNCEADDEQSSDDDSMGSNKYNSRDNQLLSYQERDIRNASRRELIGWYIYNFAAEVFVICGAGSYLPVILEQLARENGVLLSDNSTACGSSSSHSMPELDLLPHTTNSLEICIVHILGIPINTASFAMYTFSVGVLIQAVLVISISSFADHSNNRKRLLLVFAYSGAITTMLFLFVIPKLYLGAALLAIFSSTFSGASYVMLNSFLPLLVRNHPNILYRKVPSQLEVEDSPSSTSPLLAQASLAEAIHSKDSTLGELEISSQISIRGAGAGYSAGLLVQCASIFIIWAMGSTTFSLKVILFLVGFWWAVFTIPAGYFLQARPGLQHTSRNSRVSLFGIGWLHSIGDAWTLLWRRIKLARRSRDTTMFLIAWFFLSDAIATLSGTAALYAKTKLQMKSEAVGSINVIVTITGIIGAFTWSFISRFSGLKPNQVILICIGLFEFIPIYGLLGFLPIVKSWGFIGLQQPWEMYLLGFVYGFVMGGLTCYCRSLFGELIPPGFEAAFFALYAITDKGSSAFGPAIVGAIIDKYGDIRPAFWFLVVLIGIPGPLIWTLDVKRGKIDGQALAKLLDKNRELEPDLISVSYA